jgi:phage terminase large subunit GpA-like protein
MEMINKGVWIPTAKPESPERRSYHLSALIAPIFMTGWTGYVRQYLTANPIGGKRDEKLHQTFCNLVLGETYEQEIENVKADELQNNIRPYEVGVIPETLSEQDGNGRIVMITCGSDLNGKLDDARLDYEIVAHSESGATYSITHGSIGSFIPKDPNPELRMDKMTYKHGESNSVWPVFEEVIQRLYFRDSDGVGMKIQMTAVDVGYQQDYALQFINRVTVRHI